MLRALLDLDIDNELSNLTSENMNSKLHQYEEAYNFFTTQSKGQNQEFLNSFYNVITKLKNNVKMLPQI